MMPSFKDKLNALFLTHFKPTYLEVIDETHKHKNHFNTPYDKDTHFKVVIVSSYFESHSQLARHRCVMALCEDFFKMHLHALSLKTYTPLEYEKILDKKSLPPLLHP